jgi:hypothetical protein
MTQTSPNLIWHCSGHGMMTIGRHFPALRTCCLFIEVAASSLDYDRSVKRAFYARHGITYIGHDGDLNVESLPDVVIAAAAIFG